MGKISKTNLLVVLIVGLMNMKVIGQTLPQGITYQGLARNASGSLLTNQFLNVKFGIYSPTVTGTLIWEETHAVTTNQLGLFYLIIGQGSSTGSGNASAFSSINWGGGTHVIKIDLDFGSGYIPVDTVKFWSVPYAMYSGTSAGLTHPLRLHQLIDVDTIGVSTGYTLKYNGSLWLPAPDNDSDTALFANNSFHSTICDTANYARNVLSQIDTVLYSTNSGTAFYATNTDSSINANHSVYSDTAIFALNSSPILNAWNVNGNSSNASSDFIGTTNASDLIFKTNNVERMRILNTGNIGIGTSTPAASLHIAGDNGILAEGTFGLGTLPATGAGTRMMWYPKKAAFRAGGVVSTQWDDVKIGNYSFASGYSTTASGDYSTALGSVTVASGHYSIAACQNSTALGYCAISMGSDCHAAGAYGVALGRAAVASDSSTVAIGYHCQSLAKYAQSFGYITAASGMYSTSMGYYSSTNSKTGSFVFADASSTNVTNNTVDNQFMVRASGGTIFYSNTALTAGVSLAAGDGSWASVSDKHKKENFKKEDEGKILTALAGLEISSWNYKTQSPEIRHIGPMAQDFYNAFHLGESDTTITTVDADGISLIAIKALAKKTRELKAKADEVEQLKLQVVSLENEKVILEKRITSIEKRLNLKPLTLTASNK